MTPAVRLGTFCEIQRGGTPLRSQLGYYGGPIPWVKIADLDRADGVVTTTEESLSESGLEAVGGRLFPTGTILLAMYGSVGKLAVAGVPLATNQAILGIRVRDAAVLDSRYLLRWLKSMKPSLVFGARGVTQQNISATIVRNLAIPVPPLAEQRRIAALLDKADFVRRKRYQSLHCLRELRRSAFVDLFGDPALDDGRQEWRQLGDLVTETQYGTSTAANGERRGMPVLRMNNITPTGDIDLSDLKWCEISDRDLSRYTVRHGDLLFNRTNSPELVGKTAVWRRDESYAFAGYLVRVRLDHSRILPEFVSGYLNSKYGKRLLFERAKPSINMSNISASEFRKLPIPVPPIAVQTQYARLLERLSRATAHASNAVSLSAKLVDSVMRDAFCGHAGSP